MSFICSGRTDWQKSIIQKDILELSGIFTINDHSIIQYKSTLNLHLLYLNI